ncbi:MAG: hypothetical protein ABIN48_02935 [Ginsengibacter sp.]
MEQNRRFTILTFPQSFDGNKITVNILVLPRNQNPLRSAVESHSGIPDAPAFADARFRFNAKIVSSLEEFPMNTSTGREVALNVSPLEPGKSRALFTALANQFNIDITKTPEANTNPNVNMPGTDKAPEAIKKEDVSKSVKKYLPVSFRKSFNFISPRVKNAVIDDSYFCALREAKKDPGFQTTPRAISWGKVFAFILRQPQLAKEIGIIYEAEIVLNPGEYENGGWLYMDLDSQVTTGCNRMPLFPW